MFVCLRFSFLPLQINDKSFVLLIGAFSSSPLGKRSMVYMSFNVLTAGVILSLDKEPVVCAQCGSQFLNQTVLDVHTQRCTGEPTQRRRYKGHGRGRVGGQLECDMCGHRCVTQDGLDLHRLSHTGQTPLRCPLTPCRKRFASSTSLAQHLMAHCRAPLSKRSTPRRFICSFCTKEFAYASTFAVHMRTHTDERPFEVSSSFFKKTFIGFFYREYKGQHKCFTKPVCKF